MKFTLDVSDLTRNLDKELRLTETFVENKTDETADIILESVQEDTPVETGTALAGWEKVDDINGAVVQNMVPYIGYLDEGTEDYAGNHMSAKAIQKASKK